MESAQHTWHRMNGIAAGVVLAGCVGLLQWHSVQFWIAQIGPTGVGFSLLLDALGLWLWFHRTFITQALGVFASLLVLAGPIYWVATPIIDQSASVSHSDTARNQNIITLEHEIGERQAMLAQITSGVGDGAWAAVIHQTQADLGRITSGIAVYLDRKEPVPAALQRNADRLRADLRQYQRAVAQRGTAASNADRIQSELTDRRAKLAALREVAPTVGVALRAQVVVAMQVFALVLFQLGAILAIRRIREIVQNRGLVSASVAPVTPMPRRQVAVEDDSVRPVSVIDLPSTVSVVSTPVSEPRLTLSVNLPNQPSIHDLPQEKQSVIETSASPLSGAPAPLPTSFTPVQTARLAPVRVPSPTTQTGASLSHPQFRARRIQRAQVAFQAALNHGETKGGLAMQLRVRPSDVTLFLRHEELLSKGERTVSEAAMEKFLTRFAPLVAETGES
ncbi:MAG: hypothetical protein AABY83_15265 [Pseudomonadota bacterium]